MKADGKILMIARKLCSGLNHLTLLIHLRLTPEILTKHQLKIRSLL